MSKDNLIARLRALAVERRPEACFGCGMEHGCSVHGCAVIREATDLLTRYADAEKDGRLVVLPCEIGSVVYGVHVLIGQKPKIIKTVFTHGLIPLCGKAVFATLEEAEAAKAALEGGSDHA